MWNRAADKPFFFWLNLQVQVGLKNNSRVNQLFLCYSDTHFRNRIFPSLDIKPEFSHRQIGGHLILGYPPAESRRRIRVIQLILMQVESLHMENSRIIIF